jgi:predicted alpha/beta-hydrolase family hydrolase
MLEIDTPHGPARAHIHEAPDPRGALVLGHGAGGGIGAPDLRKATTAALGQGFSVALIEQPYRVAGRRSPAPAAQLDAAWTAVIADLVAGPLENLPLITGGRSAGARVACRTAAETGARAVLCLAFPLQPPARKSGTQAPSRLPELQAVKVPVLIVQGTGDPFGMPPAGRRRKVVKLAGNHSLRTDPQGLAEAVDAWLARQASAFGA